MAKKKKMRLGRVEISLGYTVDLDNQDMVDEARECLYEDLMNAYKYNEIGENITVAADKKAKASDIPEFLLGEDNEDN